MILIHFSINSNQQEWRWKRHLNWSGIWLWMRLFVGKLRVLADNLPSVKQLVVCRRKRRKVGLCYRVFLLNSGGSDPWVCPSRCALFSTDISAGIVLLCLLFLLRKWQYAKFVVQWNCPPPVRRQCHVAFVFCRGGSTTGTAALITYELRHFEGVLPEWKHLKGNPPLEPLQEL